jgi:hypothetical protein
VALSNVREEKMNLEPEATAFSIAQTMEEDLRSAKQLLLALRRLAAEQEDDEPLFAVAGKVVEDIDQVRATWEILIERLRRE